MSLNEINAANPISKINPTALIPYSILCGIGFLTIISISNNSNDI